MNDVFGAVVGEHFIFPAVDTTKRKDVPLVFPVFIERLFTARGQAAFDCTIRRQMNYASKVWFAPLR